MSRALIIIRSDLDREKASNWARKAPLKRLRRV